MNTQNSPFIRNLAIMASAGTGKTYQLAMRFIALILAGAGPDQIAALTFSKKAAGEILEKIISILLELIPDENQEKRDKAVRDGFLPGGTSPEQLSEVLRSILSCRNRLHIETNDSFLLQIIQAAPAEFGIHGEITMINEEDDRPRQRAMLRTLHDPAFAGSDPESCARRGDIYQILRDCSFGLERPTLYAEITKMMRSYNRAYLNFPDERCWKLPEPSPAPGDLLSRSQLTELRQRFLDLLDRESCAPIMSNERMKNKLLALPDAMDKVPEGHALTFVKDAADLLFPFLQGLTYPSGDSSCPPAGPGSAVWKFAKKEYPLDKPLLEILFAWKRHLLALEYLAFARKTRAVFDLMETFNGSFAKITRAAGKITFADILLLLNSKQNTDYGALQVLRERLGLSIRHYLFDEFQDTSTEQWRAFEDLALDVIQSDDPLSSFFMVGDIKQSIYQWRAGNPALFGQICRGQSFLPEAEAEKSSATPAHGILKSLACSYRSAEPVLRLVNDVFLPKTPPAFPARLDREAGIFSDQKKKMDFERHVSGLSPGDHPESGCSMVLETKAQSDEEHSALAWRTVCALIRRLDPFSAKRKKPLSVAVLFRKNDRIRECYEAMKRIDPALNISMEGLLKLKDSMAFTVFRRLLILAAHPDDSAASAGLDMIRTGDDGPDGLEMFRQRLFPGASGSSLSRLIREELDQIGYERFLQHFRNAFPETRREEEYMECLANALSSMEAENADSLSPDDRILLLDNYSEKRRSIDRTVQLMTIHQSKGLGFDIVILPCVAGRAGGTTDTFVKVEKSGNCCCYFEPHASALPFFHAIRENADIRQGSDIYELGCNLYVALTRAKRCSIVILPPDKASSSSKSLSIPDILRRTGEIHDPIEAKDDTARFIRELAPGFDSDDPPLSPIYCAGDPFWAERSLGSSKVQAPKPSDREKRFRTALYDRFDALPAHLADRLSRTQDSETLPPSFHPFEIAPHARFLLSGDSADFGTRVHELLSKMEWLGSDEEIDRFLRRAEAADDVASFLRHALAAPPVANALRHPGSERVRLFREQPFLLRTDPGSPPVSGIIDRAVIEYDEAGNCLRAEVIDFKTDDAPDPQVFKERYARQLALYRRALAELTGLPLARISATILALRPGLAIPL